MPICKELSNTLKARVSTLFEQVLKIRKLITMSGESPEFGAKFASKAQDERK
jgi:hypothetical protein